MLTVRMNVFLPSLTWVPVFWREKNKQDMKPVLMENAFEAWAAAIRFCDDIKDGKATLQYQKNFVSSLHNAVELIMKQ